MGKQSRSYFQVSCFENNLENVPPTERSYAPVSRLVHDNGFTLLELLIVLSIIGLCFSLVSVLSRPADRGLLRIEADRVKQLLDLASTESQLTGKFIAWTSDGTSYRFWRLNQENSWSELYGDDLLRPRPLPQGMSISRLQVETGQRNEPMRLEFTPHGSALAFTFELRMGTAGYIVAGSPVGKITTSPLEK